VAWASFSFDGKVIATVSHDDNVRLWRVEQNENPQPFATLFHRSSVRDLKFSPDGKYIATQSHNVFYVWRVESGVDPKPVSTGDRPEFWKAETEANPKLLEYLYARYANVEEFSFLSTDVSPNGKTLVTSKRHNYESFLELWKNEEKVDPKPIADLGNSGGQVIYSHDSKLIAIDDTIWRIGETFDVKQVASLSGGFRNFAQAFSADDKYLVSSGDEGVKVWSVNANTSVALIARFPADKGNNIYPTFYAISGDGKSIAVSEEDKLKVFRIKD
jgi:WD40 repeat protein